MPVVVKDIDGAEVSFPDDAKPWEITTALRSRSGGPVDPDTDALVRTVYGEARDQGPKGQQAVAAVALNRARQVGQNLDEIVKARGQFEPWNDPDHRKQLEALKPDSPEYQRILANITPALMGDDPTGGADHFYSPKAQAALGRKPPAWADDTGVSIGDHVFYRYGYRPTGQGKRLPPLRSPTNEVIQDVLSRLAGAGNRFAADVMEGMARTAPGVMALPGVNPVEAQTNPALKASVEMAQEAALHPKENPLHAIAGQVRAAAPAVNHDLDKTLPGQGADLAGDLAAQIAAFTVNPALGIQGTALQNAGRFGMEAEDAGATPEQAAAMSGAGGLIGTALGVVPGRISGRLVAPVERTLMGRILNTAATGGVLGAGAQLSGNLARQGIYDPNQPLLEGVPEAAGIGFLTGGVAHGAMEGAGAGVHAGMRAAEPIIENLSPAAARLRDKAIQTGRATVSSAQDATSQAVRKSIEAIRKRVEEVRKARAKATQDLPVRILDEQLPADMVPPAADRALEPAHPLDEAIAPAEVPAADQAAPDLTDRALDLIRSGKPFTPDRGPSLTKFLRERGGLAKTGELDAMDVDAGKRGRHRLTRKEGGMSLADAAQLAHDHGYFPELGRATMEGAENMHPVTEQHVLDAIRDELGGRPRYAKEAHPDEVAFSQHVEDLQELLHHLGVDLKEAPNAEARRRIDEFLNGHGEHAADIADLDQYREPVPHPDDYGGVLPPEPPEHAYEHLAAPAPGLTAKEKFDRLRQETAARQALAERLGAAERPVRLSHPDGRRLLITKDMNEGSPGWRATRFDKAGEPTGHMEYPTAADAIFEGLQGSFVPEGQVERVNIGHETVDQGVIPGVEAVNPRAREIAELLRKRNAKRGYAAPPAGGLFDERGAAPKQTSLFGDDEPAAKSDQGSLFGPAGAQGAALGIVYPPGYMRGAPVPKPTQHAAPMAGREARRARRQATVRLRELQHELRRAAKVPLRQGRLPRGATDAAGVYKSREHLVRIRPSIDMDVTTHEIAHALDPTVGTSVVPKNGELAKLLKAEDLRHLAYPGANPQHLQLEGFAEWMRVYMTNPKVADQWWRGGAAKFEAAMAKDSPEVLARLHQVRDAYQHYLQSSSVDVVLNHHSSSKGGAFGKAMADFARDMKDMGGPGAKGAIRGILGAAHWRMSKLYEAVVDDKHMIKLAVDRLLEAYARENGKKLDLPVADNAWWLARMGSNAHAHGLQDLLHGVTPYHGVAPEGPSLQGALEAALGKGWPQEKYDLFNAYLSGRRLLQEFGRFREEGRKSLPDSIPEGVWKQALADIERQFPEFKDAAQMVYDWRANWLRKFKDAGFISDALHDQLAERSDYVPLQRDRTDLTSVYGGSGPRSAKGEGQYAGLMQAFRGSTRDIYNPIETMMRQAFELSALISHNDTIGSLRELARSAGPEGGHIMEQLPSKDLDSVKVDVMEALQKAAKEQGIADDDADTMMTMVESIFGQPNVTTNIYRSTELRKGGEPWVYHWRDGQRSAFRLPDGEFGVKLYETIAGMNKVERNLAVDIMAGLANVLRSGVTYDPAYTAANTMKDQLAAPMLTDVGYIPFVDWLRGIGHEVGGTQARIRYNLTGGIAGGQNVSTLNKGRYEGDMRALRHGGALTLEHVLSGLEISEQGTRMGVFLRAEQHARKRGLDDYRAMVEAAAQARDMTDWNRGGSSKAMKVLHRVVPFTKAFIQGMDKVGRIITADHHMIRYLRDAIKGAGLSGGEQRALTHAVKFTAFLAAYGAIGYALVDRYKSDPVFKNLSPYVRANYWAIRTGEGVSRAPDGAKINGSWWFYPKHRELAITNDIGERAYEANVLKDPTAWKHLAQDVKLLAGPPDSVPILSTYMESLHNRDFMGRPIVPDYMKQLRADLQYGPFTSQFGMWFGKHFNVPPAEVDHWTNGMLANSGRTLLNVSDWAAQQKAGQDPFAAVRPEDVLGLGRFNRDPTRGNLATSSYWSQMSAADGTFTRALQSFGADMEENGLKAAFENLDKQGRAAKGYVIAQRLGMHLPQLEPMNRAHLQYQAANQLGQDIRAGAVRAPDMASAIELDPKQSRTAREALARYQTAILNNAQIDAGVDGFQGKERFSVQSPMEELAKIDPRLPQVLALRQIGKGLDPSISDAQAQVMWGIVGRQLTKMDPEILQGVVVSRQSNSKLLNTILRTPPDQPLFKK